MVNPLHKQERGTDFADRRRSGPLGGQGLHAVSDRGGLLFAEGAIAGRTRNSATAACFGYLGQYGLHFSNNFSPSFRRQHVGPGSARIVARISRCLSNAIQKAIVVWMVHDGNSFLFRSLL